MSELGEKGTTLKLELICNNCKQKVKIGEYGLFLEYELIRIKTSCQNCNQKIQIFLTEGEIRDLINEGIE